jgi:hypothetical protein
LAHPLGRAWVVLQIRRSSRSFVLQVSRTYSLLQRPACFRFRYRKVSGFESFLVHTPASHRCELSLDSEVSCVAGNDLHAGLVQAVEAADRARPIDQNGAAAVRHAGEIRFAVRHGLLQAVRY